MTKRRLLGDRGPNKPKRNANELLKALQLAETYLEDGAQHSALRAIRDALGYTEDRYPCSRCRQNVLWKDVLVAYDDGRYLCNKCLAADVGGGAI